MPDLIGASSAIDKINQQTLPQAAAMLHALVDRLEALLDRLDGMSVVVVMGGKKPQE